MSTNPINGRSTSVISLIIPVHNEEAAIGPFLDATRAALDPLHAEGIEFEFIFINDGSRDRTADRLIEAQRSEPRIRIIDLSRNFGKEAAMTAGLGAPTTSPTATSSPLPTPDRRSTARTRSPESPGQR